MIREVGHVSRRRAAEHGFRRALESAQVTSDASGGRFGGRVFCVVESRRSVSRGQGRTYLEPVFEVVARTGSPLSFARGDARRDTPWVTWEREGRWVLAAIVYPDLGRLDRRHVMRGRRRRRRCARGW